ncbi:hypothetical protein, partial [uncultured Akkermansia sp.]|uniref:hypothetical protein n=1 Tax=uncultured Akkermansia sp. TaxID=512294 RepID=UPI00266ECADD
MEPLRLHAFLHAASAGRRRKEKEDQGEGWETGVLRSELLPGQCFQHAVKAQPRSGGNGYLRIHA